ncbi:MAG TPA: hypothetical protein VHI13_06740 [Candidatus Kapabacteria bacterium]|nr:hypothetical protein [Candidatus Kapabacteria bacterium]
MSFHVGGRVLLLLVVAAAIAGFMPRAAHAQCLCDNYYVVVDPDVACSITILQSAPTIRFAPVVVTPGSVTPLGCVDDLNVTVDGCKGGVTFMKVGTNVGPQCFLKVPIVLGCCVRVCLQAAPNGCTEIHISNVAAPCPC